MLLGSEEGVTQELAEQQTLASLGPYKAMNCQRLLE